MFEFYCAENPVNIEVNKLLIAMSRMMQRQNGEDFDRRPQSALGRRRMVNSMLPSASSRQLSISVM
jgi:hypothetical protein